ncbi:unnamed protein product [Pleuronectes platessa]|uniref:Uncharacterized protein n=1 Tax=Pleuronectes platessa TaxID=8262 RepID=A0A9N7YSM8_PLEPL|nr:unnamed protein product [Pleuronectes platessa]
MVQEDEDGADEDGEEEDEEHENREEDEEEDGEMASGVGWYTDAMWLYITADSGCNWMRKCCAQQQQHHSSSSSSSITTTPPLCASCRIAQSLSGRITRPWRGREAGVREG